MAYIINMPIELFMDGYLAYRNSAKATAKLEQDRHLRAALVLLYASVEAELNRQLKVTSSDRRSTGKKLRTLLETEPFKSRITPALKISLLSEMDNTANSFRPVRNGIIHFKDKYQLYGITKANISRYFDFTKKFFEIVHNSAAVAEWLNRA